MLFLYYKTRLFFIVFFLMDDYLPLPPRLTRQNAQDEFQQNQCCYCHQLFNIFKQTDQYLNLGICCHCLLCDKCFRKTVGFTRQCPECYQIAVSLQ